VNRQQTTSWRNGNGLGAVVIPRIQYSPKHIKTVVKSTQQAVQTSSESCGD
jgi:hypothetical protein